MNRLSLLLCLIYSALPTAALAQPPGGSKQTYDGEPASIWLAHLQGKDLTLKIRAAYALGQIEPASPETIAALIKGVDEVAQEVRWYSADSLGRIGPAAKDAVPALLAGVKDPANDAPFRRTAAHALGRMGAGAETAVPWLLEAIQSNDAPLKVAAAVALWRINRHSAALPALVELLSDRSGEGAYLAGMAFLELGGEARPAAAQLLKTLGHPSADARRAAARVLGQLGDEMTTPLARALVGDFGVDKESALVALSFHLENARNEVFYNPRASAEQFAEAETRCIETALPALLAMFADSGENVRSAAALSAAKIGLPAIPGLAAVLGHEDEHVRVSAALALTRLAEFLPGNQVNANLSTLKRRLVAPLLVALRSKDPAAQSAALKLFAELSWGAEAEEAVPLLRAALKSADPLQRRNAAKALEQVTKSSVSPPTATP